MQKVKVLVKLHKGLHKEHFGRLAVRCHRRDPQLSTVCHCLEDQHHLRPPTETETIIYCLNGSCCFFSGDAQTFPEITAILNLLQI